MLQGARISHLNKQPTNKKTEFTCNFFDYGIRDLYTNESNSNARLLLIRKFTSLFLGFPALYEVWLLTWNHRLGCPNFFF